jgi:phenylacetate-CoA ligase
MLARALLRAIFSAAERLSRTRFWSCYTESLRNDRWRPARREALRERRLQRILNLARDSELHRQRLEAAGLDAGPVRPQDAPTLLAKLSPITKAAFRRHFPGGVTTGEQSPDWRYISTAGTTDRLTIIADFPKRDQRRSSELRVLRLAVGADVAVKTVEIPPNACNIVCGLTETGPPTFLGYFWHALRGATLFSEEARTDLRGRFERQVVLRRHTLPPINPAPPERLAQVLDAYLDDMVRLRPAYLRGFPVYLLWLAERARARGLRLPELQGVSPFGGLVSRAMADRLQTGFGAPFRDVYGTSELGSAAAACGHAPGMHLFEDLFIVHVVRKGRPVEPGQLGRLVVTDLVNAAMPLIRYEVGDVGRILPGRCPCGRTTTRLEVLGRVQEVLDTPAGPLPASDVADAFFADPAVANFRLEEVAPASFEAAVVPVAAGAAPDLRACQDRFAALHTGVRKFRARTVPYVQPEPSGKYRFVSPFRQESDTL